MSVSFTQHVDLIKVRDLISFNWGCLTSAFFTLKEDCLEILSFLYCLCILTVLGSDQSIWLGVPKSKHLITSRNLASQWRFPTQGRCLS